MPTLTHPRPAVKIARKPSALGWPAWTDGFTVELGPDPADAQEWADQNTGHHATEETPVEVLGDGPELDWDAMGDDALATDCYSRGFLPL